MAAVLAAEQWHYWISFGLVGLGLLAVIATVVGYFVRVTSTKYPKRTAGRR